MGGNPVSMVDPDGDEPFTAMLIGAAIGVISNGISNLSQGNNFFKGGLKAAAFGAIGGAISFGIGQGASQITNGFAKAAFQTAAHGHASGVMSGIQGGSYGSGFASGSLSSGMSSVAGAAGVGNVGMIGVGGLSGGVGSHLAGGDFWTGVGQGVITSGLNHAAHSGMLGNNLAASLRTGKFSHLFGPDATYEGYGFSIYSLGGVFYEFGNIEFLRGLYSGESVGYRNFGTGVGLTLDGGARSGKIYYSGSKPITPSIISGEFIGFTLGLSRGSGFGYTKTYGLNKERGRPGQPTFSGVSTSDWSLGVSWPPKLGYSFGIIMGRTYVEGINY